MQTSNFKGVVYLSKSDYDALVSNGSITKDGQTLTYNRATIYVTDDNSSYSRVYTSIASVSSSLTTSSTMLQVMLAMANNSKLIADISSYTNLYPNSSYTNGLLEIEKLNVNRASARYTAKINSSLSACMMWYGEFQSAQSGYEWSGWHQVLNGSLDQTVGGKKTFSSTPILNNNIFLQGKFTGGTAYNLIGVNSSNGIAIGNTSTGLVLNTSSSVLPSANSTKDLGNSSYRWRNIYLSGNLNDGTNTISVANIANKNDIKKLYHHHWLAFGSGSLNNSLFILDFICDRSTEFSTLSSALEYIDNLCTLQGYIDSNGAKYSIVGIGSFTEYFAYYIDNSHTVQYISLSDSEFDGNGSDYSVNEL